MFRNYEEPYPSAAFDQLIQISGAGLTDTKQRSHLDLEARELLLGENLQPEPQESDIADLKTSNDKFEDLIKETNQRKQLLQEKIAEFENTILNTYREDAPQSE